MYPTTSRHLPIPERVSALEQSVEDLKNDRQEFTTALQRLNDKLDAFRNWAMGAMFTSLLAAIGLVINLLKK